MIRQWVRKRTTHDRPTYLHRPSRVALILFPTTEWVCINPHAPPAKRTATALQPTPWAALEHAACADLQYDHGFRAIELLHRERVNAPASTTE